MRALVIFSLLLMTIGVAHCHWVLPYRATSQDRSSASDHDAISALPDGRQTDGLRNDLFIGDAKVGTDLGSIDQGPLSQVITLAGIPGAPGFNDGPAATARFHHPHDLAIAPSGALYIADRANHRIRVLSGGIVQTIAGVGQAGSQDGSTTIAQLNDPHGVWLGPAGQIYVADSNNHCIRLIAKGMVSTVAGSGMIGSQDGSALGASFNLPYGVAGDSQGTIYIADKENYKIRILSGGMVSTLAGTGSSGSADGPALTAMFDSPYAIFVNSALEVYVADRDNQRIRKIAGGMVTTVAGSDRGYIDGPTSIAKLDSPHDMYGDSQGRLFIADTDNNRIRMIANDQVSTVAGNGIDGHKDGLLLSAEFRFPYGVAVHSNGTIYVADTENHVIRAITP